MRSTPTPEATRRTVKVAPASVPCLTARTMPSNAWRRTFMETTFFLLAFFCAFISSMFCQTRTVSPARNCQLARAFMLTGEILTADFGINSCEKTIAQGLNYVEKYEARQKGRAKMVWPESV